MALIHRPTLTQFLIEERRRFPTASGDFNALILDISIACKAIAKAVSQGELGGAMGNHAADVGGSVNVQGETQKKLDVLSNDVFIQRTEWAGHLAGMASEEMDLPYQIPGQYPRGKYLLVFDPLDGSSNIDVNVSVGSIFSILRGRSDSKDVTVEDFLQRELNKLLLAMRFTARPPCWSSQWVMVYTASPWIMMWVSSC